MELGVANLVRAQGIPVPGDEVLIKAPDSDLDGCRAAVRYTWASALTVEVLTGPHAGETAAVTLEEVTPAEASEQSLSEVTPCR